MASVSHLRNGKDKARFACARSAMEEIAADVRCPNAFVKSLIVSEGLQVFFN